MFFFVLVFFLVFIFLEWVYVLIWFFCYWVVSLKGYIYGVIFVWIGGVVVGVFILLVVNGVFDIVNWIVFFCGIVVLVLMLICVFYIVIWIRFVNSVFVVVNIVYNREWLYE